MTNNITVSKYHTYTGHSDCLYALARLDDTRFLSSGADGQVVMWSLTDITKGTLLARLPSSVYALHYDNTTKKLIVGQNFEGIHLIDMEERRESGSVKLTDNYIFDIKTDQDQIYVATGEGELIVIDKNTLIITNKVKVSEKNVRTIAMDNHRVMVGSSDHYIRIYDKLQMTLLSEIQAHANSVFSIEMDNNGEFYLTGGRDAHLKVWNMESMELKEDIVAHMYAINDIEFSPDGLHFVTCSMDKSIKVWDSNQLRLKKVIDKARHAGHGTSVNKLLWMKYRNLLVSCSDDNTISVWDINFSA